MCSRAHFYLQNINKIRHLVDRRTASTLVHVYVTSRLDSGNAPLCGLPQTLLSKVQRVQNAAARLVCPTGRREHITRVLQELHWLPVHQQISFKVLVLRYQALHGTAPQYMAELFSWYQPTSSLRSSDSILLAAPQRHLRRLPTEHLSMQPPRM